MLEISPSHRYRSEANHETYPLDIRNIKTQPPTQERLTPIPLAAIPYKENAYDANLTQLRALYSRIA
jgi:hypothetical protein